MWIITVPVYGLELRLYFWQHEKDLMTDKKPKRRLPVYIRWIGWVLLVQFVLINISAAIYAYRLTHFYNDPALIKAPAPKNIFSKTWKIFTGPRQVKQPIRDRPVFPIDTIALKTANSLYIDAWYSPVDSARGTVVLFHGITINKTAVLDEAYEFRYWGYNIMLVDLRGHGNSEGKVTTIGVSESEEVKLAYDFLVSKGEKNIFLYGSSLGAVVVAKAISDYQLKPSGIILEMPFANLQAYLKARARLLGFPEQPFAFLTTCWISMEQGLNGFGHQTKNYAKDITCPVLMQWGRRDAFVPENDTRKIYDAIPSVNKELVVYPQGQHESLLRHDPAKWRETVEGFLK